MKHKEGTAVWSMLSQEYIGFVSVNKSKTIDTPAGRIQLVKSPLAVHDVTDHGKLQYIDQNHPVCVGRAPNQVVLSWQPKSPIPSPLERLAALLTPNKDQEATPAPQQPTDPDLY
jgi:hypothetical protein